MNVRRVLNKLCTFQIQHGHHADIAAKNGRNGLKDNGIGSSLISKGIIISNVKAQASKNNMMQQLSSTAAELVRDYEMTWNANKYTMVRQE